MRLPRPPFRLLAAVAALLCAVAGSGAAPRPVLRHPGAPIYMEVDIFQQQIELRIAGEQDVMLPHWLGLKLEPYADGVSDAELEEATRRGRAFFAKYGEVRVGGEPLPLKDFRVEFPEELTQLFQKPGVRMLAHFAIDTVPRSVSFRWLAYDGIPALYGEPDIPIATRCRGQIDFARFTKTEPEHIWQARPELERQRPAVVAPPPPPDPVIPVPALSLGLALLAPVLFLLGRSAPRARWLLAATPLVAAALTTDKAVVELPSPFEPVVAVPQGEEAKELFERLHAHLYMAFQGSTEGEIYELLAASVAPGLIDELYGKIYESLVMRSEGGAVCSIKKLEVLGGTVMEQTEVTDPPQFEVDWRWRVYGEVSHWGHRHSRINEYRALYEIEHDGHAWKIAAVEMLDQRRLDQ